MGVVFFLGFVMIAVAIGAVPLLAGIIILIRRSVKKRKTGEKQTVGLAIGAGLTGIGILVAGVPLLVTLAILGIGIFAPVVGGVTDGISSVRYSRFFEEKVKTGTMAEGVMLDAYENGFAIGGKQYIRVHGVEVEFLDKHRKEAVANIKEGPKEEEGKTLTIFSYEHDSGCDLVCLLEDVYCLEEDCEKLDTYYRSRESQYTCRYYDEKSFFHSDSSFHISFPDEVFFSLLDRNTDVLKKSGEQPVEETEEDIYYQICQKSEDGFCNCCFDVNITPEQEVFICSGSSLFGEEFDDFLVTDQSVKEELFRLGRKVQKRLEDG